MATPLTATPIPAYTALPDVPADLTSALNNLEKFAIPRFATIVARDAAITAPVEGQLAFVTASHAVYEYNGSAWQIVMPGALLVTSATRPASPWNGCEIVETDTSNVYLWDGSAWRFEMCLDKSPYAMSAGTTTFNVTSGGTGVTNVITYPSATRFTQNPMVVAQCISGASNAIGATFLIFSNTTTGFSLQIQPKTTWAATGSIGAHWMAIQMTPTSAGG